MKVIGNNKNWSEFELDPQKAWERGRALDASMKIGMTPHPRGVWRMTHAQMNAMDLARQREQAAKLNPLPASSKE
jgi:hypothetical protein